MLILSTYDQKEVNDYLKDFVLPNIDSKSKKNCTICVKKDEKHLMKVNYLNCKNASHPKNCLKIESCRKTTLHYFSSKRKHSILNDNINSFISHTEINSSFLLSSATADISFQNTDSEIFKINTIPVPFSSINSYNGISSTNIENNQNIFNSEFFDLSNKQFNPAALVSNNGIHSLGSIPNNGVDNLQNPNSLLVPVAFEHSMEINLKEVFNFDCRVWKVHEEVVFEKIKNSEKWKKICNGTMESTYSFVGGKGDEIILSKDSDGLFLRISSNSAHEGWSGDDCNLLKYIGSWEFINSSWKSKNK